MLWCGECDGRSGLWRRSGRCGMRTVSGVGRAERHAAGIADELAWVGMFVDDLVGVSADDELVDASGMPRLDDEGITQSAGRRRMSKQRGVCC